MIENLRGTNIALVSWVTSVIMFFAVSIKLGTRIMVTKTFTVSIDGGLIFASMAFALGQTGAITCAVQAGLGKHLSTLTASQINSYQQSIYAADLLFIITLGLTKLSIVAFFMLSTIGRSPRLVGSVLGAFILSWIIVSVLPLAFKCDLPHPWMFISNKCINRQALWYFIVTTDVITDLLILALPFYTLKFLHLTTPMRQRIITPFFARIVLLPLVILRLYYLVMEINTQDPPYDRTTMFLLEIIQMNVAVIVSCIPFSRLLMTSVSSGLMTTNVRHHAPNFDGTADFNMAELGQRFSGGAPRSPNSRMSKNSKLSRDESRGLGSVSLISEPPECYSNKGWEMPWRSVKHTTKISNCSVGVTEATSGSDSPSEEEQNIIRTTTWAVNRESKF